MIAKEQGKQYTKRLLPEFLRRYCRIRLDLSLEFYTINYTHSVRYDWETACTFLGCLDIRTAKRHLTDIQSNVPQMDMELAHLLSHKSGFFTATETFPDTPPVKLLALLVDQVYDYHTLLYGNQPPISPTFYTPAWITHVWFSGSDFSTSYVVKSVKTHDSS